MYLWSHALRAEPSFLPPDAKITGDVEQTATGLHIPEGKSGVVEGIIPENQPVLTFRGRVGKGNEGMITMELKDAESQTASLALRALELKMGLEVYPDNHLSIGWQGGLAGWGAWHFRPNPLFYRQEEWEQRREAWKKLPSAWNSSFTLEMRPADGKVQVWIEGQFMQELPLGQPVSYRISLRPGATLESLQFLPAPILGVLSVEKCVRAGTPAILNFDKNADLPDGFRDLADAPREGIRVEGLGDFSGWMNSDLQNYFWRRHASYALPEQPMFSVPLAAYSHAWVLCTVDDRAGKTDDFTFRVTRYGKSRGPAMADTVVRVNADNKDARRVGTVRHGDTEIPLWLVRVPILNGLIQDLLYDDKTKAGNVGTYRYLDVELLNPLANVDKAQAFPPSLAALERQWKSTSPELTAYDIYPYTPPRESGVTVFGIKLERAPAELRLLAKPGVKAFYETDKAEFLANVQAHEAGTYKVEWKVANVEGEIVDAATQSLKLGAGASADAHFSVKSDLGWFAVQARLLAPDGRELVEKQSSYVMLPPDTRQAGYESPFYGWWFGKNHDSDIPLEQSGMLLQRLGIRRVELTEDMPESLTKKYGFTNSTVRWLCGRDALRDFTLGKITLQEAVAAHEADIRHHLELWPSIDRMLVFHESGARGAPFPSELWGTPARNRTNIRDENSPEALLQKESDGAMAQAEVKAHEQWEKWWPKRMEYLAAMAKMVRENFPGLKMQYGNDGNSLGIVGEIFRQKFPREFMDTIAIEDLGQTMVPENPRIGGLQSAWFLREVARKMGYGDVPITACPEWIGRMTEKLGLRTQAEWKARDTLLALAYGFDTISVAGLNDAGDGYYFSIWANGGLTGRWPEMAPKPAYAAIATLTRVLDRAKFTRFVPSGSTVLYVQEFQRGNEWVYTLWTPRGERDVKLTFAGGSPRTVIDLYGREEKSTGESMSLVAGTSVQYIVSKEKLKSVELGATRFPQDAPPKEVLREILLDSLAQVEIMDYPAIEESSRRQPDNIPQKRQGKFEIREVEDPEMGRCLEVELIPEGELRWSLEHEYVVLKLKTPVKTDAKNAGLWIKGNGSWGAVDILKSQSWGPWATNGNLNMVWSGGQTLNFDGWNFIRYPYYDWIRKNDNIVQGVIIFLPRKALVGTEMQPVENLKVRIKKVVLF